VTDITEITALAAATQLENFSATLLPLLGNGRMLKHLIYIDDLTELDLT
jgi:hypothetical protein